MGDNMGYFKDDPRGIDGQMGMIKAPSNKHEVREVWDSVPHLSTIDWDSVPPLSTIIDSRNITVRQENGSFKQTKRFAERDVWPMRLLSALK